MKLYIDFFTYPLSKLKFDALFVLLGLGDILSIGHDRCEVWTQDCCLKGILDPNGDPPRSDIAGGTVDQKGGRTRGDIGVAGDLDFRQLGVLKIGGGLMMSSKLLLCNRRFFFAELPPSSSCIFSLSFGGFSTEYCSNKWEGIWAGSLAQDFLKGDNRDPGSETLEKFSLLLSSNPFFMKISLKYINLISDQF